MGHDLIPALVLSCDAYTEDPETSPDSIVELELLTHDGRTVTNSYSGGTENLFLEIQQEFLQSMAA